MQHFSRTIRRLARRQRTRFWLSDLLTHAHLPSAWIALVLLIAGAVHQGFTQLAAPPVWLVAAIPPLLYLAFSFHKRPTLVDTVTRTDLRLEAHSLFIAAWESAVSARDGSDLPPLLAGRVESRLPGWRERLDAWPYPRPDSTLLTAWALCIIGGLLLILPGKPGPLTPATESAAAASQASDGLPDPVALINAALLRERRAATPESQANGRQATPASAKESPETSVPDSSEDPAAVLTDTNTDLAAQRAAGKTSMVDDAPALRAVLSEATHGGSRPSTDDGSASATESLPSATFERTTDVRIELPETTTQTASDPRQGDALIPTGASRTSVRTSHHGAAVIGSQLARHRLSMEQRSLVERYFEQLRQHDESTP